MCSLPGPVKVVYEAGADRIRPVPSPDSVGCGVCGDRAVEIAVTGGKSGQDRCRDALHLARLLRLDEIVEVTVPAVGQEAARDLVRARGGARGDLMRCRHRLSKPPLRQGIVYSGGAAWTGADDVRLRSQRFGQSALQATFDSNYEAMLLTRGRRDRLGIWRSSPCLSGAPKR